MNIQHHSGPETTVTFVRKEADRTLNNAAFVDNMPKE
jgi:hypothetical protein